MEPCRYCGGTEGSFHGAVHADQGVCVQRLVEKREHEKDVVAAAWEVVLRGSSWTTSYGGARDRMDRLRKTLEAAGVPEEYGVPDAKTTYPWRW